MKIKKMAALIGAIVALCPFHALAMDRFDIVTTQEMKQMLDDRKEGKMDFLLVNALDEPMARHESIPGSINVPWSRVEQTADRLGKDKGRLIVVYCVGYR